MDCWRMFVISPKLTLRYVCETTPVAAYFNFHNQIGANTAREHVTVNARTEFFTA